MKSYMQQKKRQLDNRLKELKTKSMTNLFYKQGQKLCYQATFQMKKLVSNVKQLKNVYLLGTQYKQKNEYKDVLSKIIWFTYRQDMNGKVKSDVGWGCMIRVGQMLLAQSLQKHFDIKESKESKIKIIKSFSDKQTLYVKGNNYSFQKIMNKADEQYDLKEGQWFNPSNICYVLKNLHESTPLQGSQKLKIQISQGIIFFDNLQNKFKKEKNIELVIVILFVIGVKTSESNFIEGIKRLMKIKYFNGMIGGKSKKAFYFIGVAEDEFLYLDPHFVQKEKNQKDLESNLDLFKCTNLLSINSNTINPSIGFSFYIRNLQQLRKLCNQLQQLKKEISIPFSLMKNEKQCYQFQPVEIINTDSGVFQEVSLMKRNSDTFEDVQTSKRGTFEGEEFIIFDKSGNFEGRKERTISDNFEELRISLEFSKINKQSQVTEI